MTDQAETEARLIGGAVYATALAQIIILALATEDVIPASTLAEKMDTMALQWEITAADPNHALPDALKDARTRLAAFTAIFDRAMASIDQARLIHPTHPTPHELHVVDLLNRAVMRVTNEH